MIVSFFYVILAILGLSFLIFIHELGHYFMARRVGMRVETFSIGFGTPIVSWVRNGVKWQIGWLLFGGYVKIAGAELEGDKNPYEIPDGFFGKKPWDRIKVSLMGPLTNLVFALVAFSILWGIGGRDKNFSDYTSIIGWVDPESELYLRGVRPGDKIIGFDDMQYQGAKDLLYAPMTTPDKISVKGQKVDYETGKKTPFAYDVKVYPHPSSLDKGIMTSGILSPASYIFYNKINDKGNPLPEGSPLQGSGIQYGDRIAWVDGELVFSVSQLSHILNSDKVLLTIERGSKILLAQIPRVPVQELKPDNEFREELIDWQHEAGLQGIKIQNLFALPYNLTNNCIVENALKFIDKEKQTQAFPSSPSSAFEQPLQAGDKIIAISGMPIEHAYELLAQLQTYHVNILVQRNPSELKEVSTKQADADFDDELDMKAIDNIVQTIGTANPITHYSNYYLLNPIVPKTRNEFHLSADTQALLATELLEQKKAINAIEDSEKREHALRQLEKQEKRLLLGLPDIQDRKVKYNPSPFTLFNNVFDEIWRTLYALVTGTLNPKWMAGPIGIVQMVHDTSMSSVREALFWLGAISLNLGILNLLPVPVLDGGTILMSLVEMVTRRRLHPKTMEKLIIPFAILLIAFFLYLTYNDLLRIFGNLLE